MKKLKNEQINSLLEKNNIILVSTEKSISHNTSYNLLIEEDCFNLNTYKNNILNTYYFPEVFLHPNDQIRYAIKILKEISFYINNNSDNKCSIVISHSPYMIEAFQRFSEEAGIKYSAMWYKDRNYYQVDNSANLTLSYIFERFSDPFELFENMDSESMQK